jgi:hypothetical protein
VSGIANEDERNAAIDSAWRREFREEPSPDLDAAVRAAARRELAGHGERRARRAWSGQWVPFAAAAGVAALAFGLLRWLPADRNLATVPPARETQSTRAGPEVSAREADQGVAPAADASEGPGGTNAPAHPGAGPSTAPSPPFERRERATAPAAAPAQTTEPPAGVTLEGAPSPGSSEVRAQTSGIPGASAAKATESTDHAETAPVEDAIRRLVDLYDRGRLAEAAERLRELRAVEPAIDEQLPERLRTWAATVTD